MSRKYYRISSNSSTEDLFTAPNTASHADPSGGKKGVPSLVAAALDNATTASVHQTTTVMSHSSRPVENTRSYEFNFNLQNGHGKEQKNEHGERREMESVRREVLDEESRSTLSIEQRNSTRSRNSATATTLSVHPTEQPTVVPKITTCLNGSRIELNLRYFIVAATSFVSQQPKVINKDDVGKRSGSGPQKIPPLLGGPKSITVLESMFKDAHEVLSIIKRSASPTSLNPQEQNKKLPSSPPKELYSEAFARADDEVHRRSVSPDWMSSYSGSVPRGIEDGSNLHRSVSPVSMMSGGDQTVSGCTTATSSSTTQVVPLTTHVSDAVKYICGACRALPSKAIYLLEQAALLEGNVLAKTELALCLLYGHGTSPNVSRALQLLDECVAAGHPAAMLAVGKCLRDGVGVIADVNAAMSWICRSAQMEYLPAMHELGEMFEDGLTVKTPPQRTTATESVCVVGVKNLNNPKPLPPTPPSSASRSSPHSNDSTHLEKDLVQSFRWYRSAATKGYPPSQLNLGKLYLMTMSMPLGEGECVVDPKTGAMSSGVPAYGEAVYKAAYWLQLATNNGVMEAKGLLERLNLPV